MQVRKIAWGDDCDLQENKKLSSGLYRVGRVYITLSQLIMISAKEIP